jgi:carbonic anhydrase/acetyltransferase-like protein (isoleucine patch superfamily)
MNVQEGSLLHTDIGFPLTIGPDCTTGHHAILHGCRIGENSLIGMGVILLNGAKIGNNCIVGANALVTDGKEFPDDSLIIGSPARLTRKLVEASAHSLRAAPLIMPPTGGVSPRALWRRAEARARQFHKTGRVAPTRSLLLEGGR